MSFSLCRSVRERSATSWGRARAPLLAAAATIQAVVLASPVVCSDETSARVRGKNWWEWVFVGTLAVLHIIQPSRGKAVVRALFGEIRPGVWVSDMLGSQRGHGVLWQVCLAHLLRDAKYAIECGDTAFSAPFRLLLLRAVAIGRRRATLKDTTLKQYLGDLDRRLDRIMAAVPIGEPGRKLRKRMVANRAHLFVIRELSGDTALQAPRLLGGNAALAIAFDQPGHPLPQEVPGRPVYPPGRAAARGRSARHDGARDRCHPSHGPAAHRPGPWLSGSNNLRRRTARSLAARSNTDRRGESGSTRCVSWDAVSRACDRVARPRPCRSHRPRRSSRSAERQNVRETSKFGPGVLFLPAYA
jgi:hypothetical protein